MTGDEVREFMGVMHYQIQNGGFEQLFGNVLDHTPGHIDRLIGLAAKGRALDIPGYAVLEQILVDLKAIGSPEDLYDEAEEEIDCCECNGEGQVEEDEWDDDNNTMIDCDECGGEGTIIDYYEIDGHEEFEKRTKGLWERYCEHHEVMEQNLEALAVHHSDVETTPVHTTVKPRCKLIGTDGNAWSLMARVGSTLKENGRPDLVSEMVQRVTSAGSYQETLRIFDDYVEVE